mgnify:CR=1 FL=1
MEMILSETAFNEPSLLRARYLSAPGWSEGRFQLGQAFPAITERILKFSQPLEKSRLVTRLKGLKASHTGHPYEGNIYHIRGKLLFTESSEHQELSYTVLSGHLSLQPTPPPVHLANGSHPGQPHQAAHFVVFSGCGLDEAKLRDWLRACAKQKPEKRVHRVRASLTKTEISRVHKEHHLDALPEGWFYNGNMFVSLAGDKSSTHPDLDRHLDLYLAKVNQDVDKHNAHVDRLNYVDLFE